MIIGNKYLRRVYDQKDGRVYDQKHACLFVVDPKSRWTAWATEFLLANALTSTTCWMPRQMSISIDKTLYQEGSTPIIFGDNEVIW